MSHNLHYETGTENPQHPHNSGMTDRDGSFWSYPQNGFGYPMEYTNGVEPPALEGYSSSVSVCRPLDSAQHLQEDDSEKKKLVRRIQNREAASRCRRKKLDRISELRESLHEMYARSIELNKSIENVEAELKQLKSTTGLGRHNFWDGNNKIKEEVLEDPVIRESPMYFSDAGTSNGNQYEVVIQNL